MTNSIFDLNNYFFNAHSIPWFVSGVLIIAEAIFIFLQNRKSLLNIAFSICAFSAGIWLTGIGLVYCCLYEPIAFAWYHFYTLIGISFITPAVYMFSTIWEGRQLKKKVKFIYLNFGVAFIFSTLSIFSVHLIRGSWSYPWGFYPKAGVVEGPLIIWFYILAFLSFRNLIRSYKSEKMPIRKKQAKLIIIAFIFGFIGSVDFLPKYGVQFYAVGAIFVIMFSTLIAYAIVHYKLMEIETAIHKTVAWFFTSAALVAPLAILLYFTRPWYIKLAPIGIFSYFGAILLCFLFFVKAFQPKVDSFFQRGKAYLDNVLTNFAGELLHLRSLEEVINKISDTIASTIHVGGVTILLHNNKAKRLVAVSSARDSIKVNIELDPENPFLKWVSQNNCILDRKFIDIDPRYEHIRPQAKEYFRKLGAMLCIPLVLNGKLLGLINLGQKVNSKPFSSSDHHFLLRIKNQSTITISNSLVYDRVEEMVKVRTEELIEAQKQLIHAEKLATIGTLAGGVAHEINNPLTAITMHAYRLNNIGLDEEVKGSVKSIEEATERCRTIIQKLMVYSRKPIGKREVAKVDLEDVLKNVTEFLEYQLEQKNIQISLKKDNPPFVVLGNQGELEQVLTNLIINARDAMEEIERGGEVEVALSREGSQVIIKVKDEGKGIAEEDIKRIFDPFFTTKEVGKGTGLGLSICQSIIEQHGGQISAESSDKDGATFIVMLPVHAHEYEYTSDSTRT